MSIRAFYTLFFVGLLLTCVGQTQSYQLKQAKGHAMQYLVSSPDQWRKEKKWPVLIILEAAEKEYKTNLERFINARGEMPFILVAPYHINNGNQGRRDPNLFPYSTETWDYIDKIGDCTFNAEGLSQIMKDVKAEFNGEAKFYVSGFEAGTHTLWSLVFGQPESFYAAVPVGGNYRGRCVDVNSISSSKEKENLIIMALLGENDDAFGPNGSNFNQWTEPKSMALKNGFKNVSETVVPGVGHAPMPKEVQNFCYQHYKTLKN